MSPLKCLTNVGRNAFPLLDLKKQSKVYCRYISISSYDVLTSKQEQNSSKITELQNKVSDLEITLDAMQDTQNKAWPLFWTFARQMELNSTKITELQNRITHMEVKLNTEIKKIQQIRRRRSINSENKFKGLNQDIRMLNYETLRLNNRINQFCQERRREKETPKMVNPEVTGC